MKLDLSSDTCAVHVLTDSYTAEHLGGEICGSSFEVLGEWFAHAMVGQAWDDSLTAEQNDAEHDRGVREGESELKAAGMEWIEQ